MVRTTVVGNYPRVGDTHEEQRLRRAIARHDLGEVTSEELHNAERDVVRDILREQASAGIDLVTDGQVTWTDSQSHLARGLGGIEIDGLVRYFDTNTYYRQPVVVGPVSWRSPILVEEWRAAQSASKRPVKGVLTGPVTLAELALDKHYGGVRPLAFDLAKALAQEVAALQAAGARHIQIDEPILSRRPEQIDLVRETLGPLAASKGPAELSLFIAFGDVAKIYRRLQELPVDVLGLDLVQGAKTWAQIKRRGSSKPLVLGLVDARNTKAEDPAALAARVGELRGRVDLDAAYLSPSNGLEFLPRAKAREKLSVLAKAATLAEAGP
ncbi:MAG: hypothetical protein A3K59_07135 [Euryarchaeota archaeon RBG_19FT_COMBO_69_17]|nr:MAG: hypothetical protein A3K59_07135 [Euryarchaeota archaeon RBG_19FT_COMBO_69_17]